MIVEALHLCRWQAEFVCRQALFGCGVHEHAIDRTADASEAKERLLLRREQGVRNHGVGLLREAGLHQHGERQANILTRREERVVMCALLETEHGDSGGFSSRARRQPHQWIARALDIAEVDALRAQDAGKFEYVQPRLTAGGNFGSQLVVETTRSKDQAPHSQCPL